MIMCAEISDTQTLSISVFQIFQLSISSDSSVSSDTVPFSKSEYQRFQLSICPDLQTIILCAVDQVISQSNIYIGQINNG